MNAENKPEGSLVRLNEAGGFGEMEVLAGENISGVLKRASMIAVTEGVPIHFTFNSAPHIVTPEQARERWTKDGIRSEIAQSRESVESNIRLFQRSLLAYEKSIGILKELGKAVHGEEFAEEIKEL